MSYESKLNINNNELDFLLNGEFSKLTREAQLNYLRTKLIRPISIAIQQSNSKPLKFNWNFDQKFFSNNLNASQIYSKYFSQSDFNLENFYSTNKDIERNNLIAPNKNETEANKSKRANWIDMTSQSQKSFDSIRLTYIDNLSNQNDAMSIAIGPKIKLRINFKILARIILILLSYFAKARRQVTNKAILSELNEQNTEIFREYFFDKEYFSRPKEYQLPLDVKNILQLPIYERTDENIKYVVKLLNFMVPEFSEFPLHIQQDMARYGFFQEIETERVVIRQGHQSENYYYILSGIASVVKASQNEFDELVITPVNTLKRGDGFGDLGIINNTKRSASVINNNQKPLCLLSFNKTNYFDIQGNTFSKNDIVDYLRHKCEVFNKLDYQFNLKNLDKSYEDYMLIHFRKGQIICENSLNDDWMYVIKSGMASVFIRFKLDYEEYVEKKSKLYMKVFEKIFDVCNTDESYAYMAEERLFKGKFHNRFGKIFFKNNKKSKKKYVYFKIESLTEAKMFGIHHFVLSDDLDTNDKNESNNSQFLLISEGCDCILVNKKGFITNGPVNAHIDLRKIVSAYPSDEYLKEKYFNAFNWIDYKECIKESLLKPLKINSRV